jgi:hypothetical protein
MNQCRIRGTEYGMTKAEERNDMSWFVNQCGINGTEY